MRKRLIATALLLATLLVGCGQPKFYNADLMTDWEQFNEENADYHVVYAFGKYSCFSDGSYEGNQMYKVWEEKIKK